MTRPSPAGDRGTVEEGDTLHVEAPALLYNDTDAEGDTLKITAVGNAVNGKVSLDGTTVIFEHDGSETITGSFSYTVTDGTDTDTNTVAITVAPVNDPPVAVGDTGAVDEGDTLSVETSALLDNDTDAENDTLSITAVGDAVNGTVSLDGTTITYEHDGSETTTGSFSYTIADGTDTDTNTVAIAVAPANDPPVAAGDRGTVEKGDTLHIEAPALLYNDTDAEGDTLKITAVGIAVNGKVSLDGTTVIFEHDGSETTTGSFSYTVTDGTASGAATVEITVVPIDDAPVTAEEKATMTPATPRTEATASPTPGLVATPATTLATPPEDSVPPTDDGETNLWLIMLIIVLAAVIAGGGVAIVLTKRNRA